ncbi:MAG TPA: hypothetical protein VIQ30_16635 [Pseudonocardia sp.]|jgi:hypothetical protein
MAVKPHNGTNETNVYAQGAPEAGKRAISRKTWRANAADVDTRPGADRKAVLKDQKAQFGGIHWLVAFFGWLTATGAAVLLTALATALAAVTGLATPGQSDGQISPEAGIGGAVLVLIAVAASYYVGGYVAGRMARFNGPEQGLAVWLLSIVGSGLIALIGLVSGPSWDALSSLTVLPRIPVNDSLLTTGGIIAAVIGLAATLGGAMFGGLMGTRFHRKIDRVGFDR